MCLYLVTYSTSQNDVYYNIGNFLIYFSAFIFFNMDILILDLLVPNSEHVNSLI